MPLHRTSYDHQFLVVNVTNGKQLFTLETESNASFFLLQIPFLPLFLVHKSGCSKRSSIVFPMTEFSDPESQAPKTPVNVGGGSAASLGGEPSQAQAQPAPQREHHQSADSLIEPDSARTDNTGTLATSQATAETNEFSHERPASRPASSTSSSSSVEITRVTESVDTASLSIAEFKNHLYSISTTQFESLPDAEFPTANKFFLEVEHGPSGELRIQPRDTRYVNMLTYNEKIFVSFLKISAKDYLYAKKQLYAGLIAVERRTGVKTLPKASAKKVCHLTGLEFDRIFDAFRAAGWI